MYKYKMFGLIIKYESNFETENKRMNDVSFFSAGK
jgi:hypothetical protein